MTSPPLQRHGARQRQRIIGAAINVFALQGYDRASIREIADAADMNKGNLYYYFPAKEDILFEIVDDLHNDFNSAFSVWSATGSTPVERLKSVLLGHATLVCQSRLQVRVTYESFRFLTDSRRLVVIGKRDLYESGMTAVIRDYVAVTRPHEPPTALGIETRAVLGMLNWIYEWYSPDGPVSEQEIASKMAAMALDSLGVEHAE